ncbi:hypothetical protein ASPTUDRAFT_201133, partial [Aspergillus tubingensis CBS 134.48]
MVKGGVALLAFAGPALAGVIARGGEPDIKTVVGPNYPVGTGTAPPPPPPIQFPTGTAPQPKPTTSHGTAPIKPTTSHGTAPIKPTTSHGTAPIK